MYAAVASAPSFVPSPNGKQQVEIDAQGVRIKDTVTGAERQLLVGASLSTVAWSPDSRRLLGVGGQGSPSTAYLWDAATGSVIETIDAEVPDATVGSAGWSSDGMRFNVGMGVPANYPGLRPGLPTITSLSPS